MEEQPVKKTRLRRPRAKPAPVEVPRWTRLRKPPTNGAREAVRRRNQIASGRLRAENGQAFLRETADSMVKNPRTVTAVTAEELRRDAAAIDGYVKHIT